MKSGIYLLTGPNRFFGQTRKPWVSINTELLVDILIKNGIMVIEIPFHEVVNKKHDITNSVIFYTFSQRPHFRSYIKDVVFSLAEKGNIVIPSYELLQCHENKGYAELLKQKYGFGEPLSFYFSSLDEINDYELSFPLVLKTLEGSNAKGVSLVKSLTELKRTVTKLNKRLTIWQRIDLIRRKYFRGRKVYEGYDDFCTKKDYQQYKKYIRPESSFILQQYIPGLEFDYRVVCLGEHFFVSKRLNRKNDFRASGSKHLVFDFNAPDSLLDYARNIVARLDTPVLAMDIGMRDNKCYIFEFQALHFGISTVLNGNGYYMASTTGWKFAEHKASYEAELAHALAGYLRKKEYI